MTQMYCTACGATAQPKTITRGSIWIEIVLWLFFVVPGLIYSLWRMTTRYRACRKCGAQTLVPLNSPLALSMREKMPST